MKRVFIDMDNVLVDFQSGLDQVSEEVKAEYAGRLDEIPGLFAKMKPMEGAIEAVHKLQKHYDLFILSTAPWKNPSAWSDKVAWVTKYLDDVFHKKIIITHRKDLCQGDYLIDDRGKNGTSEFSGEWIEFGSEKFPDWESVLDYLLPAEKKPGLDEILEEIGRSSLLTHEEELALLKAVQEKGMDCDEMKQLEKANMRFIVSVANQYQKRGLTLEELIEAGAEGLRKGAMKYDSSRGFKFIAYAVWWIRQSILQAIKEKEKYDEEQVSFIDDPATLQELCDKGNKYAAYELYHKCMWGDEENGIFINKREAKYYFDLAGDLPQQYEEEWDDVDDPGEECPEEFCYTLTGNADTLGAVETLINDLCQQYGTPGNELGLYVPQQILMKLLVGSDSIYYRGNVISMERQASDTLVITTEADKGEPLLYALRQCFENLNVEMKS